MNFGALRWLLVIAAYIPLYAFATQGTVVDDKGQPIEGAFVLATWYGEVALGVQPATSCYHVSATRSDRTGRFSVPEWSGNLNLLVTNRRRGLRVFVPGYELSPRSDLANQNLVFVPLSGSRTERFKKIDVWTTGANCGDDKARLPFMKAVYAELLKLAETPVERQRCASLLYAIEDIEFGREVADTRRRVRNSAN